ncbi:MAG: hypothetical protein ABH833_03020 [Parcubacteria group bacterium]
MDMDTSWIISSIVLAVAVVFCINHYLLRTYKLNKLANKYGLSFTSHNKGKKFFGFSRPKYKDGSDIVYLLAGTLVGKQISIYDVSYDLPQAALEMRTNSKRTYLEINGQESDYFQKRFSWTGWAPVKTIDNFLKNFK